MNKQSKLQKNLKNTKNLNLDASIITNCEVTTIQKIPIYANTGSVSNPVNGQIILDSSTGTIKVYYNAQWR